MRRDAIDLARQVRDGEYFATRQRFGAAFEQAIRERKAADDAYEAELVRIDAEFPTTEGANS